MFPLFTQPHAESTVYNACGCVHTALRPKATNTNTTCTSKAKAKDEVEQARIRRHRMEQCREWATVVATAARDAEQFREEPSVWHLPSGRSCSEGGKHDHARREAATRGLRLHDLTSLNSHYGRGSSPSHDGHETGCTQSRDDVKADIHIVVKREPSPPRSTYPPTAPAKWYEDEDADARASAAAGTTSRAASATALSVSAASAGLRSADTSPASSAAALPARGSIAPLTRLTAPSASSASTTTAPRRASVPDVALWGGAPTRMTAAASGETSAQPSVPTSVSAPSSPSHSTLLRKRQRESPSDPARTKRRALSPCPAPLPSPVRSHARPELASSASRGESRTHGPRNVHYQVAAAPRIESRPRPAARTGAGPTAVPMAPLASRSIPGSPVRGARSDSERDTPACDPTGSPPTSRPSSAGAASPPAVHPRAMGVSHVSLASAIMVATSATLAPRARYGCTPDVGGRPGSAKQFEQLAKQRLAALAHVRAQLATSPPPETQTQTPGSEPPRSLPTPHPGAHRDRPKFDTYHVAFETSPPTRRARALPEHGAGPTAGARSLVGPSPTPRAPASLAHLLHPRPRRV